MKHIEIGKKCFSWPDLLTTGDELYKLVGKAWRTALAVCRLHKGLEKLHIQCK
jgi:hypothetical protein